MFMGVGVVGGVRWIHAVDELVLQMHTQTSPHPNLSWVLNAYKGDKDEMGQVVQHHHIGAPFCPKPVATAYEHLHPFFCLFHFSKHFRFHFLLSFCFFIQVVQHLKNI